MSDDTDSKKSEKGKPAAAAKKGGKGLFKTPPKKPEPWAFGGRGKKGKDNPQGKPMADAERRRAMSRKVH